MKVQYRPCLYLALQLRHGLRGCRFPRLQPKPQNHLALVYQIMSSTVLLVVTSCIEWTPLTYYPIKLHSSRLKVCVKSRKWEEEWSMSHTATNYPVGCRDNRDITFMRTLFSIISDG